MLGKKWYMGNEYNAYYFGIEWSIRNEYEAYYVLEKEGLLGKVILGWNMNTKSITLI